MCEEKRELLIRAVKALEGIFIMLEEFEDPIKDVRDLLQELCKKEIIIKRVK